MSNRMMQTGSPPKAKEEAIAKLLDEKGYQIISENGQRKYVPKGGQTDPSPLRGSEVFVGKLPRDVFEDELIPLFEKSGPIYEMRLMMDNGTNNRGFAFVMYTCPEDAKKAIDDLNNYEIRKNRHLGVVKSVDNCRLFVGGIPKSKTKEEILEEMRKITDNVSRVILYSSVQDKTRNRGFAFVEFESHRAAAAARRKLIPGKIPLFGQGIAVDWAEPEPDVDEGTMSKVTILYVRNLMMATTEEKIREIFSIGDTLRIDKVKKLRDFAFVHFSVREDAEAALHELQDFEIDGSTVEVTWAKPPDKAMRSRSFSRGGPSPFFYGPSQGFEAFPPHMSFSNCPGRGAFLHRMPTFRGRGRGAAGIRRFRNIHQSPPHPGGFKNTEVHTPHYAPFPMPSKRGEKGAEPYGHEYVLMPFPPNAEGIEGPLAVAGPPLMPHGSHARLAHPGYLYAPPGYDEIPYFAYLAPGPVTSY